MSEGLTPLNRTEAILSGEDLTPTNRLEYFLKEAASGGAIPAPTEDDAGKVPVANNDGTASWQTPSGGGGGVLYVEGTWSAEWDSMSISQSYNDLAGALSGGQVVVLKYADDDGADHFLPLSLLGHYVGPPEEYAAFFGNMTGGVTLIDSFRFSASTASAGMETETYS